MDRYWNSPLGLTVKNPKAWIGSERQSPVPRELWVCKDCKLNCRLPGTALCRPCLTASVARVCNAYDRQDVSEFRDMQKGG
jgi:hypothetical protein